MKILVAGFDQEATRQASGALRTAGHQVLGAVGRHGARTFVKVVADIDVVLAPEGDAVRQWLTDLPGAYQWCVVGSGVDPLTALDDMLAAGSGVGAEPSRGSAESPSVQTQKRGAEAATSADHDSWPQPPPYNDNQGGRAGLVTGGGSGAARFEGQPRSGGLPPTIPPDSAVRRPASSPASAFESILTTGIGTGRASASASASALGGVTVDVAAVEVVPGDDMRPAWARVGRTEAPKSTSTSTPAPDPLRPRPRAHLAVGGGFEQEPAISMGPAAPRLAGPADRDAAPRTSPLPAPPQDADLVSKLAHARFGDYHSILELEPDASPYAVRDHYLRLSHLYSPRGWPRKLGAADLVMVDEIRRAIEDAWSMLGDAELRARYERALVGANRPRR